YDRSGAAKNIELRGSSSRAQLFHQPVGNIGSAVETLLAVTDTRKHFSLWRLDGFLVEFEGTAGIHYSVVGTVADEQRTFDAMGSALKCECFDFFSCFLEVLGVDKPSQTILNGWVIVKDIIDQIVCAAPNGHCLDPLFRRRAPRPGVAAHTG